MAEETLIVAEVVKRRRFPWKALLAVFLVMPVLLAIVVWRIGWPARSWETKVCPLEEIGWLEAARLRPDCIQPDALDGSGRSVLLLRGELDESGKPVFELDDEDLGDQPILSLRRSVVPELKLPNLVGKRFQAGVFWVDEPAEYLGESSDCHDRAEAYSVLLMCPESKRWEEAGQLIVDMNRNRELNDDPVMAISDVWFHEDDDPDIGVHWFTRVFEPVKLLRTTDDEDTPIGLPVSVEAIPAINVSYFEGDEPYDVALTFFPTSFRKGRLNDEGVVKDVIISPDRTRLGRFDGPMPGSWALDGEWVERFSWSLTEWTYERGTFWGCSLAPEGRALRDGPYKGPTGVLCAETSNGVPMKIEYLDLVLRGNEPRSVTSMGWAPIPRFSSFTFPLDEHPLPVGEYEIDSLWLTSKEAGRIMIDSQKYMSDSSAQTFAIQSGQTTKIRLPKTLKMKAVASLEALNPNRNSVQIWSSDPDAARDSNRTLPQPGCEIDLTVVTTDPATGNQYVIYPGGSSPGGLQVVIKDESGKVVNKDTMEYG